MAFDLIRILALVMVVAQHVLSLTGNPVPKLPIPFYLDIEIGKVGVILFILISGALLEIRNTNTNFTGASLLGWYERRARKIYPAMWLSCLLALLTPYRLYQQTPETWLGQINGMIWYNISDWRLSQGGSNAYILNTVTWFVGVIMVMYLVFPVLHNGLMKNREIATIVILAAGVLMTYVSQMIGRTIYTDNPAAYFIFFGVGVVCASWSLYPHVEVPYRLIGMASDLCLYIFLTHYAVMFLWTINPLLFIVAMLVVSVCVKVVDEGLKSILLTRKVC